MIVTSCGPRKVAESSLPATIAPLGAGVLGFAPRRIAWYVRTHTDMHVSFTALESAAAALVSPPLDLTRGFAVAVIWLKAGDSVSSGRKLKASA